MFHAGGSISGTVRNSLGDPISGTAFVVAVMSGTFPASVYGDWCQYTSAGTYTLDGLHPGDYVLMAYPDPNSIVGSYPVFYDSHVDPVEAHGVGVAAGVTTTGIDFTLYGGGQLSGYVYDDADPPNPIAGAKIFGLSSPAPLWIGLLEADTAVDGSYVIWGLPPGDYRLAASYPGKAITWWKDGVEHAHWADQAEEFYLPPKSVYYRDFNLEAEYVVTGNVSSDAGKPLAGLTVDIGPEGFADNAQVRTVRTGADGWFEFRGLGAVPGGYFTIRSPSLRKRLPTDGDWVAAPRPVQADQPLI